MKAREIYLFAQIEREHFFYRGRRDLVRYWLPKLFPKGSKNPVVIDAGAGTGILVEELSQDYDVVGGDIYFDPCVSICKNRMVRSDVYHLPFLDDFADAVVALDLLEHLDDDLGALNELKRIARQGGYIFINVPAFPALMSDWDKAVGHKRRYLKGMIKELIQKAGLEIIFLNYVNSVPFLPILIYRWFRSKTGIGKAKRLEDRLPPRWLNKFLLWCLVQQGKYQWLNLPFGVSLFAILRKPARNL